ncbi:MAG TPA: substrate-binding domain-containing protein [Tepidisphaeraceae bacterium]|nr:substrate-binding domain-containing protein [Tepidisphaeraceae bacterium]
MAQDHVKVAVLVDSSTGWGRRLIQGILQYARQHGEWKIWVEPRGQHEHLRPPPGWVGHGVIARVSTKSMADELAAMRLPIVNVSGLKLPSVTFPTVTTDPDASTRLAADHFLDRGFQHFAYYGTPRFPAARAHYQSYADVLAQHGKSCAFYTPSAGIAGFEAHQADLARWLTTLPKPCAVLCWGLRGLALLDACASAKLDVPGDVAVLSGDYDDLLCEAATPPLSGIETPSELIGHEAASLLDRLMHDRPIDHQRVLVLPTRVVARQSSDVLAIDDPDMAAALQFIRNHAGEPIDVDAIVASIPCSRRSLERKFERWLGRTPAMEIRRVQLERAKQLLVETDLPIPRVAAASGFGSGMYMSQAFKSAIGLTPLRYRSQMRARSAGGR